MITLFLFLTRNSFFGSKWHNELETIETLCTNEIVREIVFPARISKYLHINYIASWLIGLSKIFKKDFFFFFFF